MQTLIPTILLILSILFQWVSLFVTDSINSIVDSLSLQDKVTQMLMVDFRYWDENTSDSIDKQGLTFMNSQVREIIEDYNFGAVIYFAQNLTGTEQAYELTAQMQTAARKDNGVPMIICTDQEGGSVYRLGSGTALPGNMALGATGNTDYAYMAGQIMGSELSALGINTNLAPVVDVNNNANNPVIGLRSYGDDPTAVGEMACATIAGMKEYGVIGCVKHFPGHGDTATDSHYGLPIVDKSLSTLKNCELKSFEVAIENGQINNCGDNVKFIEGDLTKGIDFKADIVVANLMAEMVVMLTKAVKNHMKSGAVYISSGILNEKKDMVIEALNEEGLEVIKIMDKGDWSAIAARNNE